MDAAACDLQLFDLAVGKFPLIALGRAVATNTIDGFVKMVTDNATDQILGVHIVAPTAGDMIAEGVLAVEMAALASDIKLTIHPHPTLSETVMEAAEVFYGQSTHVYRPRRDKKSKI